MNNRATVYIQRSGRVYPVIYVEGLGEEKQEVILAVFDDPRDANVYAAWHNNYVGGDGVRGVAYACKSIPLNPDLPPDAQAALDEPETALYELGQAAATS